MVIQDMFLNTPGRLITRGAVKNVVQNSPTFSSPTIAKGFFSTASPDGVVHFGAITKPSNSTGVSFACLADDGGSVSFSVVLDASHPQTSDVLVDAKPALGGGLWVGTQEMPSAAAMTGRQCLFHWRGATKAAYSTGTITNGIGATVITGTGTLWAANACPGMFLVDTVNNVLVGVVKSVDSNTQVTLEAPTFLSHAVTAYILIPIRSFNVEASKGRITASGSSTTVIGSGTKFLSGGITSAWALTRPRDGIYVSQVASVQGDEGLTLSGVSGANMDNEPYNAVRVPGLNAFQNYSLPPGGSGSSRDCVGVLNCTYAGLQWFARLDAPAFLGGTGELHSRVWFSDYRNQNSVDLYTQDGDYIPVSSTVGQNLPIRGLAASADALLVFKENETFAILGDDPDTFSLQKVWDDGCLAQMSIVQYKGTVIWAGRNGIYIWDGKEVRNLVARSLGTTWASYIKSFDPRVHRMTAAYYKDHYFLTVNSNSGSPLFYSAYKNGVLQTQAITLCVFLPTGGLTFMTNPNLFGYATQNQRTYFLTAGHNASGSGGSTGGKYVCDFDNLFDTTLPGFADFPDIADTAHPTPDPYFESKAYSMKDPLRLKAFKQVMATLENSSGALFMEIKTGLPDDSDPTNWTRLTGQFAINALKPVTSRVKFLKRERHISIKLYDAISGAVNPGQLGIRRFAIGFKWMKVGRVG